MKIVGPDGASRQVAVNYEDGPPLWTYTDTYISGAYRTQLGDADAPAALFGVNVDTRESDLVRLDRDLLPSQFSEADPAATVETPLAERGPLFPLFRALLSAVLVLLVCESCFACWLGRKTA